MNAVMTEAIGWTSAVILLATILRQVRRQWLTHSNDGVSSWLFIGQMAASGGFSIYSFLLGNWVFTFVNVALFASAVFGQVIYLRNRHSASQPQPVSHPDRA
jgi:MtN3 and saliva related transmembrane protein